MEKGGAERVLKVRVAQVIPDLGYGGAEREVARVSALLARAGIESDVLCLYEEGHLAGQVRDSSASVIALDLDRDSSILSRFFLLSRALKIRRYDIVHVHLITWGVLAARMAGVRGVFLTEHGLSLYKTWTAILFDRFVSRFCDRMIVVARAVLEARQRKWKIPAARMAYIPNSVDPARFDFEAPREALRVECGVPTDGPLVLCVGSLLPVKGHAYLIQAAARVIALFPDVTFALAGGGGLEDDLVRQAQKEGVSDRFLFLGYRDDVEKLLKAADVFVLPSMREGTSIAILEAMAAGTPVVATDVGGNPELIMDHETGLLVPPRSPEALADAIGTLIRDSALRERVASNARQKVEREFSEEVNFERLVTLYRGTLHGTH